MEITVGIPTKNRYDSLSHTLLSVAFQTKKPAEVIIVDDSDAPEDLRNNLIYNYIFRLFDDSKIKWKVLFGAKKGQHFSHQLVQEQAETDYIFRCDDDVVLESDVLELLAFTVNTKQNVGAAGPLVLMPPSQSLPENITTNSIHDLQTPNIQWFDWSGRGNESYKSVDHLYSTFLYKKGIASYELSLSPVAHREETLFSHSIKRAGYNLYVNSNAKTYHFRQEKGGIRSHTDIGNYEHDEGIFKSFLSLWGIDQEEKKVIVLDCGIGDHFAFKNILPELREKHKKILIYACFPDVFFDESELEFLSIQDAKNRYGNIDMFNVYRKMIDWNHKESIIEAFKKLYL